MRNLVIYKNDIYSGPILTELARLLSLVHFHTSFFDNSPDFHLASQKIYSLDHINLNPLEKEVNNLEVLKAVVLKYSNNNLTPVMFKVWGRRRPARCRAYHFVKKFF